MCGLCGYVGARDDVVLRAMSRALAHRGPDGEGELHHDALGVHLAHRRLAVLDLDGGRQPIFNEDGTVAVVYNGEIYNHRELRAELEARGHRFRTDHSDTEVLVHGYEEWGTGLPERLNGMFAFAIFDATARRLMLARDRFGEKPLYWSHGSGFFAFASELHALALHPRVGRTPDPRSLQKFFAYGYLPAPNALYAGTRKLPGGCLLVYDLDTRRVTVDRYWRFALEPDERLTESDDDRLAEELRALVLEAVRRRLISDVPLGLFLSGGLDSGSVLAAAAQLVPADAISTFTIGFAEPTFDESGHARSTAEHFGTRHHEERLELSQARALATSMLGRLDEPLGDASILPTYLLARFTRQHVTVALSGDGGDELFAGYDPFKALAPAALYERIVPQPVHRALRRLVDRLPISSANMSIDFKLRRALLGLSYQRKLWNPVWLSPADPTAIAEVFRDPLPGEELYAEAIEVWESSANRGLDLVDRTLEFYTNLYLPDDILVKVDRAAMMNSLESRAVFLDNDLVAFCERLPNRFKIRHGRRKYLLRRAMADLLPEALLKRPKKGFGVPLGDWTRELSTGAPEVDLPGVRLDSVRQRWQDHRARRADHRLFLWSWLSLQATLRGAPQPAPVPA